MLSQLRPALATLAVFTLLTGLAYPLAMTGIAGAVLPGPAGGSLVERDGKAVGSSLIGQPFAVAGYLHPRPSAAGAGYDGAASSGTNLGPTSAKLAERLKTDADALRAAAGVDGAIPADAVTTSGSGLDPDVSPAYASLQAKRIAAARGVPEADIVRLVAEGTVGRTFGFLGEPRVNVLLFNLALDASAPMPAAPPPDAGAAPAAQPGT